ncbi:hypothetical protein VC83_07073 [Pseudogymnoascus destructans]|uniref:Major facilitator superfamily (MFS) profile domain-containing protein n=1 Tax=Pseudogymnoascus destructans TaxID=655981 RepID=A0A177A422_9PEZI|nr:uncharacterized protein VC83_07073 [Pseudogymnoascus destructans]OAF56857.1 hypothetical protein VC83_07073 [Pseudogymnoascus destructans]
MNFTDTQYLSTLTIYFIGYVIFEVPANIVLKKTTPQFWLPTTMVAWGIVATLLGVCKNFNGFLVARFFLGATESGLFPGVVFYLSMWSKRSETTYRVALFFSAASLVDRFPLHDRNTTRFRLDGGKIYDTLRFFSRDLISGKTQDCSGLGSCVEVMEIGSFRTAIQHLKSPAHSA